MTAEEYARLQNLLHTVIEQQAVFAENQTKAEARLTRNEEALAALLTIAEMNEREIAETTGQIRALAVKSAETDERIRALTERAAETDERLNALISVVERIVSKDQ